VPYLFQLTLELEEKGSFVGLEVGPTIIILAGWDEGKFIYATGNVDRRMGTGYWQRRGRTDAESESGRFRRWALSSKGRDDFFEKFVVEIILGPAGDDLGL